MIDDRHITTRDELIYQLAVATELEHGLCLQYLFAAMSLKDDIGEGGLTTAQLISVRKWKAGIFRIAAQEMLHLAQASNLATAAGGTSHLRRPNFPQPAYYYPTTLPWVLTPFSEHTLKRFICYERPADWHQPGIDCGQDDPMLASFAVARTVAGALVPPGMGSMLATGVAAGVANAPIPRAVDHTTIGELYAAIRRAFVELDPPDGLFIGPPDAQVPGWLVDFPQLIQVYDRKDAVTAIDLIITQGEGSSLDRTDSHFGMFRAILSEYEAIKSSDPGFEPARPVIANPLAVVHVDNQYGGYHLISDPYTADVEELCTAVYETMILILYRFFATVQEERQRLEVMASTSLRLMTGVLKSLGEAITKLPMGPDHPGKNAGPSFELWRTIELLAHMRSAWVYIHERLLETAAQAAQLGRHPGAPPELANAAVTLYDLARVFGQDVPRS